MQLCQELGANARLAREIFGVLRDEELELAKDRWDPLGFYLVRPKLPSWGW